MLSWYDIVLPHSMILSGHVKENLFVADLGNTIQGLAPKEYSDPQVFFQRTLLTSGLIHLLDTVRTKLCSGEGSGIIKLQTPFGGGKTHALISIYHYTTKGADIKGYLPKVLDPFEAKVVTIVGTNLNPLEGRYEDNICIKTIWGDIAYQLAGLEGYKEFKANDNKCISPGKDKLVNFFQQYQPFLLLFDEIAEYIVKARGISVVESNLGIQTLIFLQELTEAIASLPRGLLIITLPVHEYEDFSETKLDLINRINRILGRVESIETPIERGDLYRLITKNLINKVLLEDTRDDIISDYLRLYRNKRFELPERIQNPMFFDKMKDSYPFHPELLDLLYDRWRSLPSFQGTRTILKILTRTLIHLYASKEKIDLILPSNIDLNEPNLKNDFLKHLNVQFTSILNSDIFDFNFHDTTLDKKLPNWSNFALTISKTIFLNSFSQEEEPKGLNLSELKLHILRPNTSVSLISELLQRLHSTLHYLHLRDGRYFFSHEPNLTRKIQDLKEVFHEYFEEELKNEIKKHVGKDFKTFIWPSSSNEIPDDQWLKFVLIHPNIMKNTLKDWLEKKGTTFRQNINTIFFVLAQPSHFTDLQDQIQTKLALNELYDKNKEKKSEFTSEIKQRQDLINKTLSYNIRRTYCILFDGNREISLDLPSIEYETLTEWFRRELYARELIVSKLHYRKLEDLFLNSNQFISTRDILEQFYRNPNLFKIESPEVIQKAICWGVKEGAFGRAELRREKIRTSTFFFSVDITPVEITFQSNEFLLRKNIAEIVSNQIKKSPKIYEVFIPEDDSEIVTPSELEFKDEKTLAGSQDYLISLEVQNLDPNSLLAFYHGVIAPLESENSEIFIKMKLDVRSKKKIPETIKETISQLGVQITRIDEEE
ncbi:MAG: hypothetical protein ACFFFH_08190 [Candidatus Thorarchaeota archaeon]